MGTTKIEWTEMSWNPVVGCSKVSEGCKNCYAEKMMYRQVCMGAARHLKNPDSNENAWEAYSSVMDEDTHKWNGSVALRPEILDQPLHWRNPRRIFVVSMGDLFHPSVPFEFIDKVMTVIALCPQHTLQVLTKRAERMLEYSKYIFNAWPKNIIGMVTAENQAMADLRIPLLLQCGFKTTGVSIEPMLGKIDIKKYLWLRQKCVGQKGCGFIGASYEFNHPNKKGACRCPQCKKNHSYLVTDSIDQIIIGCESINGKPGRFCEDEGKWWAAARGLVNQGKAADVAIFMKQGPINGKVSHKPEEWPEDLRLRQFPKGK